MLKRGKECVDGERMVLGREGKGTLRPTALDSREKRWPSSWANSSIYLTTCSSLKLYQVWSIPALQGSQQLSPSPASDFLPGPRFPAL